MVLDSRAMDWAGRQGLDSASLKRAKVPIYGKWYFPDLPADEPLINLSTGETETFPPGYRAGAVLYVKEADLKQAGLGPYKAAAPAPVARAAAAPAEAAEPAVVAVAASPAAAPAVPAGAAMGATHEGEATTHHEVAASQAVRQETAHALGHAAPLRGHAVEHAHPGSKVYIIIAAILAFITAVEVAVYYIEELRPYIFPILIVLSAAKFVLVVGYFMHLKFDHISFTWYFGGGLALALAMSMSVVVLQIATHGLPSGF